MMRSPLLRVAVALLALTGAGVLHWADSAVPVPAAAQAPAGGAAARETLRLAEQRVSAQAYAGGLASALAPVLAGDAAFLLEGVPIVQGRDAIERLLRAQAALQGLQASWSPFRVLLSGDGSLGVTFGETMLQRTAEPPARGRYITVWRRSAADRWEIVAQAYTGLLSAGQVVLPAAAAGSGAGGAPMPNAFTQADLAFARLAADSGAPTAFGRYIAPDGMTLASTGELNIGPATARARLAEGRAGAAAWKWHPVLAFVAASGDLGATIGEAEIRLGSGQQSETFYSKYLTVWQRQPDGSLKFVVDGGSARPRP